MTAQDNKIPLYKRREDVLPYIAEYYPVKGFTGSELLCLFAWPWENEDELGEAISDMKHRRTDKTYPPKPVRREQLDKTDDLAMMLAHNISLDDFLILNEGHLCGLLPLKYSSELYGEFSPGLYPDASLPIFYLGSRGDLMELIRSFFINIYGRSALRSDKSIFDLDAFSVDALSSVNQSISEFEELFKEAEKLGNPRDQETYRKILTSEMDFLLICQRMCEGQADMISESTDHQTSTSENRDIVSSDTSSEHECLDDKDKIMAFLGLSWNTCKARMQEYGISRPTEGKWFLPWHIAVKIKAAKKKK